MKEAAMKRGPILTTLLLCALIALACSSGGSLPVVPDTSGENLTSPRITSSTQPGGKSIWGMWEVSIDTKTWEAEIVPMRGTMFTVDVVKFLQPPGGNPSNLNIRVTDVTDYFTEGLIGVDVGLHHPFPGLREYTGFDVYGAFITPGDVYGMYDIDVAYTSGEDVAILLNPDGYTRWMNPIEFPPDGTILSFTPGNLGNQNISLFRATINGYKYFADRLLKDQDVRQFFNDPGNVDQRGTFQPGMHNEREYDLKFPVVDDVPRLDFQYAVIASWVEPDPTLTGDPVVTDVPGDFPYNANADEAIYLGITDNSTLFYKDGVGGGDIALELEVFDWGAIRAGGSVADEVYKIVVEEPTGSTFPGGAREFDQAMLQASATDGTSMISSVFEVEITGCTPSSNQPVPLLITVENTDPDAFDPGTGVPGNSARLAGYFRYNAPVGGEQPSGLEVLDPNGGETLWMAMSHEIEWDTGTSGIAEVMLEWSTDDFVSDINVIVDSTENDGSYLWKPIPVVETDTAKVRVSEVLGSGSDESDDYFSIALPVWLDFEDEFQIDGTNVTWSGTWPPYNNAGTEFSPAIGQDTDGMVHVFFYMHDMSYSGNNFSCDTQVRSQSGSSWQGHSCFFGSVGAPNTRADSAKIAPSHNGYSWAGISHLWGYFYISDVDRLLGGPGTYSFDGIRTNYQNGMFHEIATDSAGYIFCFGDYMSTSIIYVCKSNQPGLNAYGGSGQFGTMKSLISNAYISHSRSWARQGQGMALIYTTATGQVGLAETTDAPTNDTWDVNEVIFDGEGYTEISDPALCADSSGRLFAIFTGLESSSGDYQILATMRETVNGDWTTPVVVTSSDSEFDDIHISCAEVDLPTGTTEDVAVVGWETNDACGSALSPLDLAAFLPEQDVSESGVMIQDPDVVCIDGTMGYQYDVMFAYSWSDAGNWDIALRHADFETP